MYIISYFNEDQNFKQRGLFGYFVIAVIAAFLGGLVALYLAPSILGNNSNGYQLPQNQQTNPAIPESKEDLSTVEAVAENVGPTVVGISNRGVVRDFFGRTSVAEKGSGSGVIIDTKGYIVTNHHVIEDAQELVVSLANGDKVKAELVGSDPRTDLAVLKIEAKNLAIAPLGDSDKLKTGELAVAIGNPLGIEFARSVTVGVISATDRSLTIGDRQFKLVQTDAAINPGNSGGALVNKHGQVIGINSAKLALTGVEGMGFAIPINSAKPIIEELIAQGYVSRPYLGILGTIVDEVTAKRYEVPVGILVQQFSPENGPAAKAGIKEMDIITAANDKPIKDFNDLNNVLEKLKPGDEVKISIDREGKKMNLTVVLEEMPKK
ncbi:serine protease Do [Desulfonispora thiosulfatigenes DSM 11270]|uniref:Serine protease Do n=1 Tax=Desulfonispora thiosulfatigenes DSM 11270 TaxID=656914 RepID=A0A1W1V345_DESTI|nr:trypsin-like peptidase domain-containing protein [Desulfonispora thiosulfatigenes]SMB87779.1 serine protease Do [Desulfonispora thiosulfatigenes DSM 11270]